MFNEMKTLKILLLVLIPLVFKGQTIFLKKSESTGTIPEIVWEGEGFSDITGFKIFRASVKNKTFKEIKTIHFANDTLKNGSVEFTVFDTTLTEKGIFVYFIRVNANGKEIKSPPAYGHNLGYIPAPSVARFKGTPSKDKKAIELNWLLNYSGTLSSIALYRSNKYDSGYVKVTDLASDATNYTDMVPLANEPWFYFLELHDYFGGIYPSVRIPAFATFAEKPFAPMNIRCRVSGDSVVIRWKSSGANIIGYRVFRSLNGKPYSLINEMTSLKNEDVTFVDSDIMLKKTVKAKYYVLNVSDGFVESNSSDTVSAFFAAHVPLNPPATIDNVINKDGSVKIIWIPSDEGFSDAFDIYIADSEGVKTKLNDKPVTDNYYVDTVLRSPGKYFYEVKTLASDRVSENSAITVVYRKAEDINIIMNVVKKKDGLNISWVKPLNTNVEKLKLYKQNGKNKAQLLKAFSASEDVSFDDKNVTRGKTYLYKLIAKLKNGEEVIANRGVQMEF
jgi:hypothetical protein